MQPQTPTDGQRVSRSGAPTPSRRRFGALVVLGLATLLVCGLTIAGLILIRSGGPAPGAATVPAAGPQPAAPATTPGPAARSLAPGQPPIVKTPYRYDLLSHCGIRWMIFGDRNWAITDPAPTLNGPYPDSAGTTTVTGFVSGIVELSSHDVLAFTLDDPRYRGHPQLTFIPTTQLIPSCA